MTSDPLHTLWTLLEPLIHDGASMNHLMDALSDLDLGTFESRSIPEPLGPVPEPLFWCFQQTTDLLAAHRSTLF